VRVKDNNFIVKTGEADSLVEAGPVQRIIIWISLVDVYFMLSCMNMDSAKFSLGREWDCSALDNTKVLQRCSGRTYCTIMPLFRSQRSVRSD
jgi:hypothetical protein